MRITSVATAVPPFVYTQSQILSALEEKSQLPPKLTAVRKRIFANSGVSTRFLSFDLTRFGDLGTFQQRNKQYIDDAVALGKNAVTKALDNQSVNVGVKDISAIFFVSTTGLSTPSIEGRLVNEMGFSKNVKRIPIFGLGCMAGAAGLARAADYVKAFPNEHALLLSVELCSLTWSDDFTGTVEQIVASSLFGDGAAAVIVSGSETLLGKARDAGPAVVDTLSTMYPDTLDAVGWEFTDAGFSVKLSADIPDLVRNNFREQVDLLLERHGLDVFSGISSFIVHSGGPKVLDALAEALEVPNEVFWVSKQGLSDSGNMSSASVLSTLEQTILKAPLDKGNYSLLAAMGPGFSSELVLLKW